MQQSGDKILIFFDVCAELSFLSDKMQLIKHILTA